MPKHYFLGQASHFTRAERLSHTFAFGLPKDSDNLRNLLAKKYNSDVNHVALAKNGRTALAIALKSSLKSNSEVIINGFTCYAVIEAVRAANLKPVFADINPETLHFDEKTLEEAFKKHPDARGIIIQNTLGIPVDIVKIEKFAQKYALKIFEDLAHCTGAFYPDGREVGTVGIATALSFGKEKSIDAITGGAVIIKDTSLPVIQAPKNLPKFSETFRARFYPLFGAIYRGLSKIKLERLWIGFLIKTHQIERSASSKLDFYRRPPHFVAKMALKQFQKLPKNGRKPIRKFVLVNNREELLKKLRENGFYFDGEWYETPIAPERLYKKVRFPESECKTATEIAQKIINLPTHYPEKELKPALKIIEEYKA